MTQGNLVYSGKLPVTRENLFNMIGDFAHKANTVQLDPIGHKGMRWHDLQAVWSMPDSAIAIVAKRETGETLEPPPNIVTITVDTASDGATWVEIRYAHGQIDIANALRAYLCALLGNESNRERPHNPDDVWAWKLVNVHHIDKRIVEAEWRKRIGKRLDVLANPHDSFRKIIKPGYLNDADR